MMSQRILLVEDDRSFQDTLALFLDDTYEVRQAETGAEALAILHREPITAVVLDYRLPDRTGLEVLTAIRSAQPQLPVIMMTGFGSESVCVDAFRLGVNDYFPKPFSLFELVCSLRQILSRHILAPSSRSAAPLREREETSQFNSLPARADVSIQKAAKLIQQRYWDRVLLSELAREVGMSKYHFSRHFKEVVGICFRDYLLSFRLERAKRLLCDTQVSITEVAQLAGFGDLPRFDKLFKRNTGLTPRAYRSQDRIPRKK